MVDPVVEVKAPAHVLEEIRELQHRVERAGLIAGTAGAAADAMREVSASITPPGPLNRLLTEIADRLDAAVSRAAQHMHPMSDIQPGDVVQVDPLGDALGYGAAFAIVERVAGGVILAYVRVPGPQGGDAYVRLGHGQCVKVGVAEWEHDPLATLTDGRTVRDVMAAEAAAVPLWRAALDDGTCAACHVMHGKAVGTVGTPPHAECTNPDGCRCVIATEAELRHG